MITNATILAPTHCQQCAGFGEERPATCVAQYQPSGQGKPAGDSVFLCDSCASNRWTYCNVKPLATVPAHMVTEEAPEAPQAQVEETPKEALNQAQPASEYADWFQALLDQNKDLTDLEWFEEEAYKGHIGYSLSMTDGYYAPEDKATWLHWFKQGAIGSLYWGNDKRNTLAPYVNSYLKMINN